MQTTETHISFKKLVKKIIVLDKERESSQEGEIKKLNTTKRRGKVHFQ
jgi:hypothetical protein